MSRDFEIISGTTYTTTVGTGGLGGHNDPTPGGSGGPVGNNGGNSSFSTITSAGGGGGGSSSNNGADGGSGGGGGSRGTRPVASAPGSAVVGGVFIGSPCVFHGVRGRRLDLFKTRVEHPLAASRSRGREKLTAAVGTLAGGCLQSFEAS